jgi:5'-3' exonuclease
MLNKERHIPNFDIALIDADSLMYLIAWVTPNQKKAEKGLMEYVEAIIGRTEVPEAVVFIKGENNFRYQVDPFYKANRGTGMDPEVVDRVELLYSFARKNFTESHGAEADDYVGVYNMQALLEEKLPVMCHVDKDLNMLPGWHYNFKKKEYYYTTPEESFTFMCRQLLSGDMGSDNIPGLKGVGDSTAAKLLHNTRLSGMSDEIVRQWKTGTYKINPQKDNPVEFSTPETRYKRFLDSANCLIIRDSLEELRPLTEEEILKKMAWTDKETDYLFHKDRDVSDMVLLNSLPISCYTDTKRPARCKNKTQDTGPSSDISTENSQGITTDSSTE